MLRIREGTHFPRRTSDHRRRLARHFGRKQGRTAVAAVHRTATSNIGSRLNPSSLGKRKPKKVPASINRPLSAGVLGSSREAFAIVERVARHRIERKSHVRVVTSCRVATQQTYYSRRDVILITPACRTEPAQNNFPDRSALVEKTEIDAPSPSPAPAPAPAASCAPYA